MDYIMDNHSTELSFVDTEKTGLVGMSMGGFLAARAAAFEPRLAAVMCIDGVASMLTTSQALVPECKGAWKAGDAAEFDRLFEANPSSWSTGRRWFHDDLLSTFCKDSAFECYRVIEKMQLSDEVARKIRMPAFIGDAEDDLFFEGQPAQVAKAIGDNATVNVFGHGLGAQLHCQSGALVYMNQEMLECFAGIVGH